MSIWTYAVAASQLGPRATSERFSLSIDCPYCRSSALLRAGNLASPYGFKGMNTREVGLLTCPSCGWWSVLSLNGMAPCGSHDGGFVSLRQASGALRHLDLTDLSIPTNELRSYLVAKYDDRFRVHPRAYEEIVGGVFADFGLRIRVTSYSGDEGIDVFVFDGDDNRTVGIQVKRHNGRISAEQIRSFVGALLLQGLTKGIFVTTSSYEPGARRTADLAQRQLGIGVDLVDANRFYDALRITSRPRPWALDDPSAPFHEYWDAAKSYPGEGDYGHYGDTWYTRSTSVWGSSW